MDRQVRLLDLGDADGVRVRLSTLGATMHRLEVPSPEGPRNVVLNHRDPADRLGSPDYLGGTIGRYANRVAGGRLEVDGREHRVATHDRGNALHGGPDGFDRRAWDVLDVDGTSATLGLVSPDGDMGYPGRVEARARFTASGSTVRLELSATTDAPTVVNLTHHAYLNLDGGGRSVDGHRLTVPAGTYLPTDAEGIPLGDPVAVDGTPFDLRGGPLLGDVARADHPQTRAARGLDHHLVVDGTGLRTVATLASTEGSLEVELRSDQPGLQVYTANALDGTHLDDQGRTLRQGDGVALEPQLAPDTPNHPHWPSAVLRPGDVYSHTMEWTFRQP